MSLINSDVIPASATGYTIDQSLRFNDDDSAYLSRTPSSAGNRRTWTWSGWVKRGNIKSGWTSFFVSVSGSQYTNFGIQGSGSDTLRLVQDNGSGGVYALNTNAKLRDASAWYHIVVKVDTTQSTSTDRVKIYLNGVEQSLTGSYPSQNSDTWINNTQSHLLGGWGTVSEYLDGYLAEVNFIDGQALDPTYFGETGDYGEWKPIEYTGTYGTNGFYLDFDGTYYNDKSGNGNNWTANNLSSYDVVPDSPTNNFATLNGLIDHASYSSPYAFYGGNLYEGNLKFDPTTNSNGSAANTGTIAMPQGSGKWYIEWNHPYINSQSTKTGIQDVDDPYVDAGSKATSYGLGTQASGTDYWFTRNNGTDTNTVTETLSTATVWSMAYDSDNGKIWFAKNGTWINSGNPATGTNPTYSGITGTKEFIAGGYHYNSMYQTTVVNFGQDSSFAGNKTAQGNTDSNNIGDFYYTPPSGYLALCTANLPDPAVIPSENFNTVLYTGNGTSQSITDIGFQPDFLWIKERNNATDHVLENAVNGVGVYMSSNTTAAEGSYASGPTSFDADGFSLGSGGAVNGSGDTYASWNWKANGSGVSNTDGSITSTVSANQDAGFSIVGWTSSGGSDTIGHGLSQKPDLFIARTRESSSSWYVLTTLIDGSHDYLLLNSTSAKSDSGATAPTSSVISWSTGISENHIAYCFHSVDGFSKVGLYTGNGSTDGTFVYTGFRPAFVMVKRTDAIGNWCIYDNKRNGFNPDNDLLIADLSNSEYDGQYVDLLSNGFKWKSNANSLNASGGTYIYIAFAENPFKYTNAR